MDKNIEKLENFLNKWRNDCYGRVNSYNYAIEVDVGNDVKEFYFEAELGRVMKQIPEFEQYDITYIGDFDSPGYCLSCRVLTFLYKGEIKVYPINFEW